MYADALTAPLLALIGRQLIKHGQFVGWLNVDDGLTIMPAVTCSVSGGPMPESWMYLLTIAGPSTSYTMTVPASDVVHLRYATDVARPWLGLSPVTVANLAGKLSAETLAALGDISSGPRGSFMPEPSQDTDTDDILGQTRNARGGMLFVESMMSNWEGAGAMPKFDWEAQPFAPEPTQWLVLLLAEARQEVLSAIGLNSGIFSGEGVAARESWRLALLSVIEPIGRLCLAELHQKLDPSISLSWRRLRAYDTQGLARSYSNLTDEKMTKEEAVAATGLEVD